MQLPVLLLSRSLPAVVVDCTEVACKIGFALFTLACNI